MDQYLNFCVLCYVFFNPHHNPVKKLSHTAKEAVGRNLTYVFAAKNLCVLPMLLPPSLILYIPGSLSKENNCNLFCFHLTRTQVSHP